MQGVPLAGPVSAPREENLQWQRGPANTCGIHDFVVNHAITSSTWSTTKWALAQARVCPGSLKRWPSDTSGWFVEELHVGCSNPTAEARLAAQDCCTCARVAACYKHVTWQGGDVAHSGTVW